MSTAAQVDVKNRLSAVSPARKTAQSPNAMTAFIDSCVETVAGSASKVERVSRSRPRAIKLLRLMRDKKRILVTTHQHPDPDALASSLALARLLERSLPGAKIDVAVRGLIPTGINSVLVQQMKDQLTDWDDIELSKYDASILLDVQPGFRFSPFPPNYMPTAVIDHHRTRGRKPRCGFCDIRTDVGASASIIFSYFMELELSIDSELAAILLFAIETDLAGAAGTPGELDNIALSSLTLLADTRKLYKMRHTDLPQAYYMAYSSALASAMYYDDALISNLETIISPETPAVIADFLLRFDQVQTVLVTAIGNNSLVLSVRTSGSRVSAADLVRRLLRDIGEGGGHRTKAGGIIPLENSEPATIERARKMLRRRFLRALKIPQSHGKRLVPKPQKPDAPPAPLTVFG